MSVNGKAVEADLAANKGYLPVKNIRKGDVIRIHFDMPVRTVGGKKKGLKQVQGVENAYIVRDDTEYASGQFLPLWSFGLLY